jgi:nitroimidazol reductase NimA-like FMN-containing flavoprotein (pyridoxamine 5'-phosphate oxidase superfamily)
MRRKDRAISQQEAMAVLQKAEYGILSVASLDGEPYGVPLNYCFINDAIYFHCASEGRKVDILARNNSVSFCAIGNTEVLPEKFGIKYESVIISGKAEEVTESEKQSALEGIVKKYSSPFFHEGLEYIKTHIAKTKIYKIVIQSITGKSRK